MVKLRLKFNLFKRLTRSKVVVRSRYSLRSFHASTLITKGDVVKCYRCGIGNLAFVYIVDEGDEVKYIVDEPPISDTVRRIYPLIMDHIAYTTPPIEKLSNPIDYVKNLVLEACEEIGVSDIISHEMPALQYYIVRDVVGYGPIDVPMRDPNVEEVAALGPNTRVQVVHRDVSKQLWIESNIVMGDEDDTTRFIQRLAQKCGKYVSTAFPILEAPSPEKHRIALNLADVGGRGASFVIRKFPEIPYSITQLISFNTLTPLMAAYLWLIVEHQGFIMIIGNMASGKTTMLNCLLSMAPPDYRVTTIEDTPELRLPHPNWDPLYTRRSYTLGQGLDIGLFDLAKYALRRRGQIISIGEVRGEEIQILVQAAATGQGSLCTFHATTVEEMFMRMTSPPLNVKSAFLTLIWSIVLMRRVKLPSGEIGRRVSRIWEITGVLPEHEAPIPVKYQEVFKWNPIDDAFTPNNPEEVIDKSYSMRKIMELTGTSRSELLEELRARMNFLETLVKEKVFDWMEFYKAMRKFYASRR